MRLIPVFLLGLAFLGIALPLHAQSPATQATAQCMATFGSWRVYHARENNDDVCFMVATPARMAFTAGAGETKKRDEVSLIFSIRASENMVPAVRYAGGYVFKKGSEAKLMVMKSCYSLFTDNTAAWARTPGLDKTIADALLQSPAAVVEGVSEKGGRSQDGFYTKGMAEALRAVKKACGQL